MRSGSFVMRWVLDKWDLPVHGMEVAQRRRCGQMDFIAGAKILAERFGDTEPVGIEQAGYARPLFHWCGVGPAEPGAADPGAGLEPEAD